MTVTVLSFIFVMGFALVHLSSKYLSFIKDSPRNKFLSFAGGVAVSYVFLHLLPDLNHYQQKVGKTLNHGIGHYLEDHIYLIALLGLALFYGLERLVKNSKKKQGAQSNYEEVAVSSGVFWVHMISFFLYNAVIGYLLIREEYETKWGMFFFFLALSIHFVANDHGLRKDHKQKYDKYGRVLLTVAILIGWGIGAITVVHELIVSILVALLAGGIILNVLKEELPEDQESSFVSFITGLIGFSVLMMLV
jgi:zinc transporter ZupT